MNNIVKLGLFGKHSNKTYTKGLWRIQSRGVNKQCVDAIMLSVFFYIIFTGFVLCHGSIHGQHTCIHDKVLFVVRMQ